MFEYYVLNYDCNAKKIERFNIFRNIHVAEWSEEAVKKYLRAPSRYVYKRYGEDAIYGFDALCKEFRSIFMNQFWSRREYEISVSDAFIPDVSDVIAYADECVTNGISLSDFKDDIQKKYTRDGRYLKKLDVFYQLEQNIPMIARECIYQYKQYLKEKKNENKEA